MKKLLVLAFTLIGVGFAQAAQPKFHIPTDVDNVKDVGGNWSGVETVSLVTSTNAALASDSNSTAFTDGYIHWVIRPSTVSVSDLYLVVRDTDTANLTSSRLVPRIRAADTAAAPDDGSVFIRFKPPIPFSNGLSVNLGPAGSTITADDEFAVGVSYKRE